MIIFTKLAIFDSEIVDNMIYKVDFLLIFLLAILAPIQVEAQDKQEEYHTVKVLKLQDGLPNQNINDIFFDDKGFAWIGTFGGGAVRYDGESFITFSCKTSQRIKSDYVSELCQDDYDRLWIAGARGVDILDMKTLQVCVPPEECSILTRNVHCNSICKDSEGSIWLNCRNMLYRVSFEENGRSFVVDSLKCSPVSENLMLKVQSIDNDGSIWLMLQGGLYNAKYVEGKGIRTTRMFPLIDFGQDNRCTGILRSGDEIWVGTIHGLYRINQITGKVNIYKQNCTKSGGISNDEISGLCISDDGKIVVGTLGGVDIYDSENDSFTEYSSRANSYGNKMLPGSIVRCIESHKNKLWIGMEVEGLAIMQKKRLPIINFSYFDNDNSAIPATPARSMIVDKYGRLWVGATEYGVGMSLGDMRFKFFNTHNSNLKHNTINTFCEDSRGRLWMGSVEGDLNYINLDNPSSVFNPLDCNGEVANKINIINCIILDRVNDSLWILATSGLFIYDLKESKLTEYKDKLSLCMNACIDGSSRLWISHAGGLKMIDLNSMESRDYPEVPSSQSLLPDEEGIWIGTFSNGLIRMVMKSDGGLNLKAYDENDGLVDNRIRGMLRDGTYLWITTENGLSRFDIDEASFESFSTLDGLKSVAFCEGSVAQVPAGTIFLGQKEGLSMLQSSYIPDYEAESPIITISGGVTKNRSLNLVYNKDDVEINESDGSFTLLFSDLSFSNRSDISFESRLLPDKGWTSIYGNTKYIKYERVPGGNHKIQVRAVDKNGSVLSQDEINLHVKPMFYKSWWFLVIMVILIAFLIHRIIEWRTRAINRNQERLQKEVDRQTGLLKEQKLQIQKKVDELSKQNEVLQKQIETLAGNRILITNEVATKDSKFMDDVMNAIRKLYKDPELDIYAFSEAVGMSRSMLNDKLQGAIGQSIAQFIRVYRLNVAKEMICDSIRTDLNVSDIAYEVGFNDPKYFTRCFTQQFGQAPSTMINEVKRGLYEKK